MYFLANLLWLAYVSDAARLKVQDRPAVSHNATLHRRNDFSEYGGCNRKYDVESSQVTGKEIVNAAKRDMLAIAKYINPFLFDAGSANERPGWKPAGVLETRYFGGLLNNNDENDHIKQQIFKVFDNIANWYPWFFFDWLAGRRIEVYCEQDQPNEKNTNCNSYTGMGGYALSVGGKAQIIFCNAFFVNFKTVDNVRYDLNFNPSISKDVTKMRTSGTQFLHEMSHLAKITETDDVVVHDLFVTRPGATEGEKVYGAALAELFAIKAPQYAYLNADNYAWYAAAKYFSQWYGEPDPTPLTNAVDIFLDDWVGDNSTASPPTVTEYDTDYDEISAEEAIAFAAGDYTPDGWLQGKSLRILPLGDSITNGFQSTDGNGYRGDLLEILVGASNAVQMVGSLRSGTMTENENEGHDGATIAQIATFTSAYNERPNVILLHAGTNDLNLPSDPSTAPQRLDSLVGQLLTAMPDAVIIVARIIPSTNAGTSSLIPLYNNAITDLMVARAKLGQHVMIVDMPSAVTTADLFDGLHPNDEGYNKMAVKWAIALTAASDLGWIGNPVPGGSGELVTCAHDPTWISQGEVANGAGLGADLWLTASCASNPVSGLCDCEPTGNQPLTQQLLDSTAKCDIQTLTYPLATAVRFADLNGDGRAEYLWVDSAGAVTAFLNLGGPDDGPNAAKTAWLPSGVIATGVGATRGTVLFADLNGDGRAEYLWVHDDGSVDAWLNLGGPDDGPNAAKVGWLSQGTIATGVGRDGAGVRFADLNGDGRAEYLYVNTDGSVDAWLNLGGPDDGPNAAKVGWLPQGTIATGVGVGRDSVVFADINGDGRADYLAVDRKSGSAQLWLNGGGPDNGPNAAKVTWFPHGTIATGVGGNAMGLQFADLNGDGRAEYLDVAFDTSAVTVWLNGC